MSFYIRQAFIEDLPEILKLFKETVEQICSKDYSTKQLEVWVSSINNHLKWETMVSNQYFLVAIEEDKIIGFGSLENGNYLDVLYIHKNFQRKGVANCIYEALEKEAIAHQSPQITSDVSITAKPFFEAKGFEISTKQEVIRQNITLVNYKMIKNIAHASTTNR